MIELPTEAEPVRVVEGDCRAVLPTLLADSFDAVVTDPPYGLEFMGKEWDAPWKFGITATGYGDAKRLPRPSFSSSRNPICRGCGRRQRTWEGGPPACACAAPAYDQKAADDMRQFQEWSYEWASAALRVLKPGGYMVAMGGTRTYHRLTCAIEDAGFEVRDCIMFMYGTGFPKGKGCLKPAWEPIVLARKPGPKVLPLGIDGCRIECDDKSQRGRRMTALGMNDDAWKPKLTVAADGLGRWPANVVHDGSDEVLEAFAAFGTDKGAEGKVTTRRADKFRNTFGAFKGTTEDAPFYADTGTAARFFYCAKASKAERGEGNTHPTVKPLALMRWLVRLVCPPGGLVLDPFGGSGTTGKAAAAEGMTAVLIEQDATHAATARRRIAEAMGTGLLAGVVP